MGAGGRPSAARSLWRRLTLGRGRHPQSTKPSPQRPSTRTSQGTAHGPFARAISRGHLNAAEMAGREMGGLSLDDALDLNLAHAGDQTVGAMNVPLFAGLKGSWGGAGGSSAGLLGQARPRARSVGLGTGAGRPSSAHAAIEALLESRL